MMNSLHIPKRDKEKGMAIWCNKNSKRVTKQCCQSGKKIHTCNFAHCQKFITEKHDPVRGRMVTIKRYPKELRDFKEYKKLHQQTLEDHQFIKIEKPFVLPKKLIDCEKMYLDWEHDIDEQGNTLPERKLKRKSKKTLQGIENYIRHFNNALRSQSIKPEYLLMSEIKEYHADILHDYLVQEELLPDGEMKRKYSPSTYNHCISQVRAFFRFLINEKKYDLVNLFRAEEFKKRPVKPRTEVISLTDFNSLLDQLESLDPIKIESVKNSDGSFRMKRKNMYREWLREVWQFSLFTGLRPEEVASVKVGMIKENYIEVMQPKVKSIRWVPLLRELKDLVDALIAKYNLEDDDFLVAPFEKNRSVVRNHSGNAFSHYWRMVFPESTATRYSLRNTYATIMVARYGEEFTGKIGLHNEVAVTLKHYANQEEFINQMASGSLLGNQ